ncbi:cell wall synthesis protein Wag31 [Kineococcus sp. NUM-3379]
MTTTEHGGDRDRRLSPADVQNVMFSRGAFRRGYDDHEVDSFLDRVEYELTRLIAEKAELRDHVQALEQQIATDGSTPAQPPTAQAVRILSAAQQTADQYVADAESYSRRLASEAREQYEQIVEQAREQADALLQHTRQQAANGAVGPVGAIAGDARTTEELQAQVVYLQAFAQACRTQLRSYLEALLTDVEAEWGRADPNALPPSRANGRPTRLSGAHPADDVVDLRR